MVQSWENFMDPSGGSFDNSFILGGASIAVDLGMGMTTRHIIDPLEKFELNKISRLGNRYNAKVASITSDVSLSPLSKLTRERKAFYRHAPALNKASALRSEITSKYRGLRGFAKGVGWTYLAIMGGSIAEALTTPGISKMAEMSNASMMQPQMMDSAGAYTQRQRALMAIHESQLGIRGVIGSEAGYLHK